MRLEHPARLRGDKLVVIVGGGFAGLNAAKQLANQPGLFVILLDQRNHHLFQPLLYQVATAGLNPADIAVPIRGQFRRARNVEVHLGQVSGVDLTRQVVIGGGHELPYDYLVLACGARHCYFGRPEWRQFAPGLKTLEQATEIRRRILDAFEHAENELDLNRQASLLTFVIVGGGPTGVELAGAIADVSRTVLRGEFRRIDPATARIVLIEGGPRVLPSFSPSLSQRAMRDLAALGVEVQTNTTVEDIDPDGVTCQSGKILSQSVFWAAGVQAAELNLQPDVQRDQSGRIRVNADFSLSDHPAVFVVGDMAAFEIGPRTTLPAVAPVAIQAGRHAAAMILADQAHRARRAFRYRDRGQMATIGKCRAIAQAGRVTLAGRAAWLAWLFVHLLSMIGFRNRVAVFTRWTWSYLMSRRESRLIMDRHWMLRL